MNYQKIYNDLVDKAKKRNWKSKRWRVGKNPAPTPVEVHHILPKCLGGTNDKSNLVVFSLKEHFLAHYLLTKIYEDDSIVLAFSIMLNRTEGKSMNDYSIQREKHFKVMSRIQKEYWTDEKRELNRQRGLELAKDKEYLKRVSEGVKRAYETTNLKEKVRQTSKERMEDPEFFEFWYERYNKWCEEYWTDEKREEYSEKIKKQNKENPELAKKRLEAIKDHQKNKPKEWRERAKKLATGMVF